MDADLSKLLGKRRRFGTVIADPPWPERGGTNGKAGWSKTVAANAHYETMAVGEIVRMGADVSRLCLPDAHLYLWTTNLQIATGVAADVVRAWGFRPLSVITWRKTTGSGIGQYHRGKTEHLVFAVRGRTYYAVDPETGKRAQGATFFESFDEPRGRHSEKPQVVHGWAEKVSPGPRIELFARSGRKGWASWGFESPTKKARAA